MTSSNTNQSEAFGSLTNDTMPLDIGRRNPSYENLPLGVFSRVQEIIKTI